MILRELFLQKTQSERREEMRKMHNTVQIMHYDVQLLINCTIDINFLLTKRERMRLQKAETTKA
jgi:hypothetical protein